MSANISTTVPAVATPSSAGWTLLALAIGAFGIAAGAILLRLS